MYKTLLKFGPAAVLGFGMIMGVAQAQDASQDAQPGPPQGARRGGPQMDPEQQLQRMKQQLKLTDDQVGQIRPILLDAQKQSMALRGDTSMAPEDRRAKGQSIRQDAAAKVRAVLTDDQKTQYDAMAAKREQMMQQRRQQGGGSGDAPAPPPSN